MLGAGKPQFSSKDNTPWQLFAGYPVCPLPVDDNQGKGSEYWFAGQRA